MPRPVTVNLGPFSKGLSTALDPSLTDGFVTFQNADISKGVIQGFCGYGTAVASGIGTFKRFLHLDPSGVWLHSGDLNWAFDDASDTTQGDRITYRTNLGGTHEYATVIVGANEYRLGIDAPGGSPAVSGGTGGSATYAITFYCPDTGVESNPKLVSGTATGPNGASLTALPAFPTYTAIPDPDRTNVKINIYRTAANDASGTKYYLTQIAAVYVGTTTFTDNTGTYSIDTTRPLDWGDGGNVDNDALPDDHRPPLALTVLPNALHSVNEGASGLGSGILIAGSSNWLVWSKLGYPHYWPAVNQMRLDERVNCVLTVDAVTYVFTENEIYSVSGVADYALSFVKTAAPYGVRESWAKTVAKTPLGVVFLSREGLSVFDGNNCRLLSEGIIDPYDLTSAAATYDFATGFYYQGHYFLSFNTGITYVFDLRNPGNIVAMRYAAGLSAFTVTKDAVSGVPAGLFAATEAGDIVPWRPNDRGAVAGQVRQNFQVRTGEITLGDPIRPKKFKRCKVVGSADLTTRFYVDGGALLHTHTGPGLFWLPTTAYGTALEVSVTSASATSELVAIEVQGEVQDGY